MVKMFKKYLIRIKKHFNEVKKTKDSAHSIALGFAIGTFISILPTPFINIWLGFLVILIFKKVNKYSLFASLLFWNSLTLVPITYISYKIGDLLFGNTPVIKYNISWLNQVYNYSRRLIVGNVLLAIPVSIIIYFLIKYIVIYYRKRHS